VTGQFWKNRKKSEAIACARRCRSSQLTRRWTEKNNRKKWRAKEEERHKGLLTQKNKKKTPNNSLFSIHDNLLIMG
jgi:hypothetical protein